VDAKIWLLKPTVSLIPELCTNTWERLGSTYWELSIFSVQSKDENVFRNIMESSIFHCFVFSVIILISELLFKILPHTVLLFVCFVLFFFFQRRFKEVSIIERATAPDCSVTWSPCLGEFVCH